jgi:hypothetical protein
MTLLALLVCCQLVNPPVEDRIPFAANYTLLEALHEHQLTGDASEFYTNLYQNNKVTKAKYKELMLARLPVNNCYSALVTVVNPRSTDLSVRSALCRLKQRLSEQDYKAGKLPPPVPAEYRKEFDAWRAKIIEDDKNGKRPKD